MKYIIFFGVICSIHCVLASLNCVDVLTSTVTYVGTCTNKWSNIKSYIHPTQAEVGYSWIEYKVENDFSSKDDAQTEMDSSFTPAVIGPDNKFYVVDDHHTLCALDYSGYDDVTVTVNVICDKRSLSMEDFWSNMTAENLVYLLRHPTDKPNVLPVSISYTELPTEFQFERHCKSFQDDPWRSLAGYSRKVTDTFIPCSDDQKYCGRCFYRGCVDGYQTEGEGVPFFEFRWSYYMNYAVFNNISYWPSEAEWKTFKGLYDDLPVSVDDLSDVNTDDWFDAATSIIPLCRAPSTGTYSLPSDLFPAETSETLPGYVKGMTSLEDDPSCSSPICS